MSNDPLGCFIMGMVAGPIILVIAYKLGSVLYDVFHTR